MLLTHMHTAGIVRRMAFREAMDWMRLPRQKCGLGFVRQATRMKYGCQRGPPPSADELSQRVVFQGSRAAEAQLAHVDVIQLMRKAGCTVVASAAGHEH